MRWEHRNDGVSRQQWNRAMSAVSGVARLEAAVDVVAKFVEDQPPGRQLDLEPGFAYEQMARALPMITEA